MSGGVTGQLVRMLSCKLSTRINLTTSPDLCMDKLNLHATMSKSAMANGCYYCTSLYNIPLSTGDNY